MIPVFTAANQVKESVAAFFGGHKVVLFKKGELIMRPDDPIVSIYFLLSGYVRMYSMLSDGRELTINIFKAESFFPLYLAFNDKHNTYFYQTLTPVKAIVAPKEEVMRFIRSSPDVLFDFTKRISIGIHGLLIAIQHQLFGSVHQRIVSTIYILSKRFGEKTKEGEVRIEIPLTHQEIAHFTGIARETASVELAKLQQRKIISYAHKKICVIDSKRLEDEILLEENMLTSEFDV